MLADADDDAVGEVVAVADGLDVGLVEVGFFVVDAFLVLVTLWVVVVEVVVRDHEV